MLTAEQFISWQHYWTDKDLLKDCEKKTGPKDLCALSGVVRMALSVPKHSYFLASTSKCSLLFFFYFLYLFVVSANTHEMAKAILELTLFQKCIASGFSSVHQLNAISLWWFCK